MPGKPANFTTENLCGLQCQKERYVAASSQPETLLPIQGSGQWDIHRHGNHHHHQPTWCSKDFSVFLRTGMIFGYSDKIWALFVHLALCPSHHLCTLPLILENRKRQCCPCQRGRKGLRTASPGAIRNLTLKETEVVASM